MGKLNTKLNMSTPRHPRTHSLTERVYQTMQTLLRCYCVESGFDWTSQLSMAWLYYNYSINEVTTPSPFEVMYGYQPSTQADRLLPLAGAKTDAYDRLTLIKDIRYVDNQLLKLYKKGWQADQLGLLLFFSRKILFISQRKGYTSIHKNANTLEIRN